MLDLNFTYRGAGMFETTGRLDLELAEKNYKPGSRVRAKTGQKRSVKQNDFFHALIQAAFDNQRGPRLPTWRHLKSHLLIAADHCDETRVSLKGLPAGDVASVVAPIAAALRRQFETVEISYDQHRHDVILRFAKSWRFEKTEGGKANEITGRVVAIICTEIVPGLSPDDLRRIAKEATE